jgi:hypothetical protein
MTSARDVAEAIMLDLRNRGELCFILADRKPENGPWIPPEVREAMIERWELIVSDHHYKGIETALRAAKLLCENINEFGYVTDDGFYTFAESKINAALGLNDGNLEIVETLGERPRFSDDKVDSEVIWGRALEEAAKVLDRRVENYIKDHGIFDTETGATEFLGNGEDFVSDWEEIAEEIRSLIGAP